MKKSVPLIILIFIFFSCTSREDIDIINKHALHKETIEKENCSLVYTYNENLLSYGDNAIITINLNFPVSLYPMLKLNSTGKESIIQNGVIIDIIWYGPFLQNDGSIDITIKIIFEAFLPGTVSVNPFTIELISSEGKSDLPIIFRIDLLKFEFAGDPSLISMETHNTSESQPGELAEFISIPGESESSLIIIIVTTLFILVLGAIILVLLLRKKTAPKEIDNKVILPELRKQFEKEYCGENKHKDLRPAYGELKKIIRLTPGLTDKQFKKEQFISECNKVYFPGKIVTGETAANRLKEMFYELPARDDGDEK